MKRDKELGMDAKITRRDFLDGVALTVGGAMLAGSAVGGSAALLAGCGETGTLETPASQAYPPALTGLRGSINPALAVPHALRDGSFWQNQEDPKDTGESYDLVVVGGGISGLSAAYVYTRDNPGTRVLVLDNHDDFGGHARRNEYTPVVGSFGRLIIGYGGTQSIDHPRTFSRQAKAVLAEIGVKLEPFYNYYEGEGGRQDFYAKHGLVLSATFFDKETWGSDYLAIGDPWAGLYKYLKDAPMSEQGKKDVAMLRENPKDWLPGLTQEEKWAKLTELTYTQWLTDYAKVDPDAVKYQSKASSGYWGYGADGIGAIDAWADWYPGFDGLGLSWNKPYKYNAPTEKQFWEEEPYIYHYPDGCHGIARLLVRQLIPDALPGRTQEDQVLARLDYARLDQPSNRTRIRLSSPVVKVRNTDGGVEVQYVRNGEVQSVKGKGAVMACYYSILPYIVEDYPEVQKKAAHFSTRIPLLYANTLISNWRAFEKLKIQGINTVGPGSFWLSFDLDMPVSMGGYEHPSDPDQPILLHWNATPCELGMNPREGVRVGRQNLYKMTFEDLERKMRDLMARSLGSAGFDPATDIQAITINRWAHGYAFEYAMPWDKDFYPNGPLPGDVAATPVGKITFASTDRRSQAYVDSAIDAAVLAVGEQSA